MSRVGRRPIPVPKGVEVDFGGGEIAVRGPRGTLRRAVSPDMSIEFSDGVLTVSRPTDSKTHRCLHGLTRTLIANMIQGVSEGFQKDLEIVGVGYRAQISGEKLIFQLGYSHPVEMLAPPGISFRLEGANKVMVSGSDKELVGKTAAQIRALRPPDHYKGKGIRYSGERVRLKAGKSGKAKK
jgi:large subunit ribosomal protein L6